MSCRFIFLLLALKFKTVLVILLYIKRKFVMARTTGRKRFWFQQSRDQISETKDTIQQPQQLTQ